MTAFPKRLLARTSEPATEPVTLAEAKLYLRVDSSAEDALITDLIAAARMGAEEYLQRSLITQSWKLAFDGSAPECTRLPRGPVIAVTSVSSIDSDGGSTAIAAETYALNAAKDTLEFSATPTGTRVEIVYSAGFGAAGLVPRPIKLGVLAHIAQLYERRGDAPAGLPQESIALFTPYREVRV